MTKERATQPRQRKWPWKRPEQVAFIDKMPSQLDGEARRPSSCIPKDDLDRADP